MATILVVDDEKPVREFLAVSLEQAGHRVLQAYHGRHAMSVIAQGAANRPDLVISDVMMPVGDGVELCRMLKADAITADIPVVLMSAAMRPPAIGALADGFLVKPFDLDAMDALIDQLLSVRPPGDGGTALRRPPAASAKQGPAAPPDSLERP
jgi:CheY-like chemotaxis protein